MQFLYFVRVCFITQTLDKSQREQIPLFNTLSIDAFYDLLGPFKTDAFI